MDKVSEGRGGCGPQEALGPCLLIDVLPVLKNGVQARYGAHSHC